MQAEFGFAENQTKPYTFNAQPFLVDKQRESDLQSWSGAVEKLGGREVENFSVADSAGII